MFHLLSDLFFYLPGGGEKKKQWACCITAPPGVDAFHQCIVGLRILTGTQRGSPAKITSLIHTAERKLHKTQQKIISVVSSVAEFFNVYYSSRDAVGPTVFAKLQAVFL